MKVLLLGATGNLGVRLVPALLTHGHTVVTYVRSQRKLETLLPVEVFQRISVVEGDAKDAVSIKAAITNANVDAVINTAGLAALAPWGKSDLPAIFKAVLDAVREAGRERGQSLRTWFLGGTGVLYFPGTENLLSSYVPIYLTHRQNRELLQALPANEVDWSMLCPSTMTPESSDFSVPTHSSQNRLVAQAGSPPLWRESWIQSIPFIGRLLSLFTNITRYDTTLEQNADFIASDLESRDSRWIGKLVGIIDPSK